jgi:hypothetical protein
MKPFENDKVLREILTGDEVADFRQASLQAGLLAMRRQRLQRQVAHAAMLVLIPVFLATLWFGRTHSPRRAASSDPAIELAGQKSTSIKFISDEELFALFPNRSVALIGQPGHQQLVFLDESRIKTQN